MCSISVVVYRVQMQMCHLQAFRLQWVVINAFNLFFSNKVFHEGPDHDSVLCTNAQNTFYKFI